MVPMATEGRFDLLKSGVPVWSEREGLGRGAMQRCEQRRADGREEHGRSIERLCSDTMNECAPGKRLEIRRAGGVRGAVMRLSGSQTGRTLATQQSPKGQPGGLFQQHGLASRPRMSAFGPDAGCVEGVGELPLDALTV
ncbi:hypothetical protein EYF80_035079 [Liparis tanakae]|uniref:Uncharacterized protein n=1 Tax=Liparis tanakae TaxID=230148 RepID=A0A4Z2GMJ1_9TELE|nr:hypothetical protein EYF80_035079 [Liparis tanakae]